MGDQIQRYSTQSCNNVNEGGPQKPLYDTDDVDCQLPSVHMISQIIVWCFEEKEKKSKEKRYDFASRIKNIMSKKQYLLDTRESLVDWLMDRSSSLIRSFNSLMKWELLFDGVKFKYALALITWSFISFTFSSNVLDLVRTIWLCCTLTVCDSPFNGPTEKNQWGSRKRGKRKKKEIRERETIDSIWQSTTFYANHSATKRLAKQDALSSMSNKR